MSLVKVLKLISAQITVHFVVQYRSRKRAALCTNDSRSPTSVTTDVNVVMPRTSKKKKLLIENANCSECSLLKVVLKKTRLYVKRANNLTIFNAVE